MQDMWQKILNESRVAPNTKNLESLLFMKIQKRIRLINRIKFTSYLTANILSGAFLFIYAKGVYSDLISSGAYNYFHLLISEDLATLNLLYKEIIYSLIESLPTMSMTLLLGLMFMVMFLLNETLISLKRVTHLKIN